MLLQINSRVLNFLYKRPVFFSFAFLVFGLALNIFSSALIIRLCPDRAVNTDLFFMFTPYVSVLQYATDPILVISLLMLVVYIAFRKKHSLSYYFTAFGYFYIIRGLCLPLTPLGRPLGNSDLYGFFSAIPAPGMFPSGHTGAILLAFLLIEEK